jgi:SAM-dependent methyltransferase
MGPGEGSQAHVAHLLELRRRRIVSVRVFGDREKALAVTSEREPPRRAGRSLPDRVWSAEREYRGPADETVTEFVASLDPAREALDLGCGDARLTAELRAEHLTAADISLIALKRARRRLPNATLVLIEPAGRLPFEDEAFDLVLCADTIQEIQDVAHIVAEMKRVLRPGGTLALTAPAYGRTIGWSVLRHGFREQFDPRAPALRFLTPHSLGDLLDLAGFHPIEIERSDGRLLATARR